jgi:hypothetical protein
MMVVNLASAHRHLNDTDRTNATLDREDWSASANEFKNCVAALKGDTGKVVELFPAVVESKSVESAEFRRWPVFDFVRTEPKFQEAFEAAFGEPLSRSATSNTGDADADTS